VARADFRFRGVSPCCHRRHHPRPPRHARLARLALRPNADPPHRLVLLGGRVGVREPGRLRLLSRLCHARHDRVGSRHALVRPPSRPLALAALSQAAHAPPRPLTTRALTSPRARNAPTSASASRAPFSQQQRHPCRLGSAALRLAAHSCIEGCLHRVLDTTIRVRVRAQAVRSLHDYRLHGREMFTAGPPVSLHGAVDARPPCASIVSAAKDLVSRSRSIRV
jgi:hypothetical protein